MWSKASTEPPVANAKTSVWRRDARSMRTVGSAESRSGTGPSEGDDGIRAAVMRMVRHSSRRVVPFGANVPRDNAGPGHLTLILRSVLERLDRATRTCEKPVHGARHGWLREWGRCSRPVAHRAR